MATTKAFILYVISLSFFQCCCCFSFAPATKSLARNTAQEQLRPSSVSLLGDDDSTNNNEESLRRRIILAAPTAAILLSSNIANAAETTAESIRLLSSKTIPGLGPPDVYYPSYFVGKWKATKVITTSDDNFWNDLIQIGVKLPVTIVSEMRFIPYDAGKDFSTYDVSNPNNVPAIADRSFNENSYYAALSKEINRLYQSTKSLPSIQSSNWTPTNPNVLSLTYTDGSSKEIKVTKRSSDVSKDGINVFSSEFRRVTDVPTSGRDSVAGGIPSIYKSRSLTKWRRGDNDDVIEGIEILYNEQGTLGEKNSGVDPLMGGRFGQDTKDLSDWRSTKTKILMERIV